MRDYLHTHEAAAMVRVHPASFARWARTRGLVAQRERRLRSTVSLWSLADIEAALQASDTPQPKTGNR